MGRRRIRHCAKCGLDHEKPTGLKCTRIVDRGNPDEFLKEVPARDEQGGAAGGHPLLDEKKLPAQRENHRAEVDENDRL